MQVKKNPKKNLNKNSMLYFQIGLSLVLVAVLISAQWKSYSKPIPEEHVFAGNQYFEQDYIVELPKKELPKKVEIQQKKLEIIPTEANNLDDTKKVEILIPEVKPDIDSNKVLGSLEEVIPNEPIYVPFAKIQDVPIFPGCERHKENEKRRACMNKKLKKFVNKHFDKELGDEYGLSGFNKIASRFMVTSTGEIQFINVRGPHPKLEEEAKRIIDKLPQMQPGKQRDQPVNVIFELPINFLVND